MTQRRSRGERHLRERRGGAGSHVRADCRRGDRAHCMPTLAIVVVLVDACSRSSSRSGQTGSGSTRSATAASSQPSSGPGSACSWCSGCVLAAATVGNAVLAFRTRPILIGDGYRNPTVERYQDTDRPDPALGAGRHRRAHVRLRRRERCRPLEDVPAVAQRRAVRPERRLLRPRHRLLRLRLSVVPVRGQLRVHLADRHAAGHGAPRTTSTAGSGCRARNNRISYGGAGAALDHRRPLHAAEGGVVLARPLRPGDLERPPVHRDLVHRRPCGAAGQEHPRRSSR